jgi:putative SOS response-associated peptidase YedK
LQILHDIKAAQDRINLDNISRMENIVAQDTVHDMLASGRFAHGEIFPSTIASVVANNEIIAMKWGFPHWKNSGVIINARAETAADKNMFRRPLKERRCVVPSSGFYEWSRSSNRKAKDKYLFRQPDSGTTLYMAGISNTFRDALGNEYDAFTILTTEASDSVAPFHDRMPVILAPDEIDMWITDNEFTGFALHRPGPELTATLESNNIPSQDTQLSF